MVIINGRFLVHRITGVERYARELLAELDEIIELGTMILVVPPEVNDVPSYRNIIVKKIGIFHNRLWEQVSFPMFVWQKRGISLNLCNTFPILSPGIVCIHDMRIKARPSDFCWKFVLWYDLLFKIASKFAKRIITVSEFSKKEICKYYNVESKCITVIPNAWQHIQRVKYDESVLGRKDLVKDNFYFTVCSLEPNKNIKWIAEAAQKTDEVFAVAGSINESVFADGLEFAAPKNLYLLGYLSDEEIKTLMRDCKAFLFPSFYEGFGIPPIEALGAGTSQLVVSDIPVFHEIFEKLPQYVDPNIPIISYKNEDDFVENKDYILSKYSWEKSAQILYGLIDKL